MSSGQYQAPKQKQQSQVKQFGCPCGKSYLSYPALYTHIKTKHDGKAPGELKKPKNEKTRGRPRTIIVDTPLDDSQCPFDLKEEIQKTLNNISTNYQQDFQISQGSKACQDMASKFYLQLKQLSAQQLKAVKCYLNELKHFIIDKFGQEYWKQESPSQIIIAANELYQSHEVNKEKFPLEKNIFIQMTFLLFKWMYRNKWTTHRLLKRDRATAGTNK